MTKTVYNYDEAGVYIGEMTLDESDMSPLEPGVYLIPALCTEIPPPDFKEGTRRVFKDGEWSLEDLPKISPDTVRSHKLSSIARFSEALILDGVKVDGHWFGTDPRSRSQHQTFLDIANYRDVSIEWQTLDGETVTMNLELSCKILTACLDLEQKTMKVLRAHRIALTETSDPEGYDIKAGWPITFSTRSTIEG